MIQFDKFILPNGLRVIVHQDLSTPMAVVDVMYDVGSRDEDPDRTGFAHLFEHLMFGGSKNIPSYDEPLQKVGGENNAFTNTDITNYYLTVPASNIETGFWLESDRMGYLLPLLNKTIAGSQELLFLFSIDGPLSVFLINRFYGSGRMRRLRGWGITTSAAG